MLKTITIVPTILADNEALYRTQVEKCNTIARRIQIDVTDGVFAPSTTIGLDKIWWPTTWETDLHYMAARPSEQIDTIIKLHPSLCILHAEADEDLMPVFRRLKDAGIKTGVALLRTTFPNNVRNYIEAVDHVMIFAGELGTQGSRADMMQTEKVALIREINPDAEIGWDGGANINNIRALSHAGLDVVNVGSALSKAENPAGIYQALTAEVDKNGVVL